MSTSKWRREKPLERVGLIAGQARRRDRVWAWGFTAAVHVIVLMLLLRSHVEPSPPPSPDLVMVRVLDKPPGLPDRPDPGGGDDGLHLASRPAPPVPEPVVLTMPDHSDELNESQIAGAIGVGEGAGGGGGCDLGRSVQEALRRDRLVHSAMEGANRLGKAVMMWNGDWVRAGGQDGKGLSAVRESIQWVVAFAPEACRNEPMHNRVLLSLADGNTRFAIGTNAWRWSDLLGLRKVPQER